ncbi:MAG: dihydrodipicolinate synthase family protein, partial [Verrucomicrobiales bacterium]|nr:dihydrodipicolinate synthase family protein [Verrucomicrobiales bacterium]
GGVGSTYNYMAGTYLKMMEAFAAGDLETARGRAGQSVRIVELLNRWGGMRTGKALMGLQGLDMGPVRLPVVALEDGERESILETAKGILA